MSNNICSALINTLSECINGLLDPSWNLCKSLRGRGHVPSMEIVRYLERRFAQQLRQLGKHQYPILETTISPMGSLTALIFSL